MNTILFLKYEFFYLVLCFTTFLCCLLTPSTIHYLAPGEYLVYFILFCLREL